MLGYRFISVICASAAIALGGCAGKFEIPFFSPRAPAAKTPVAAKPAPVPQAPAAGEYRPPTTQAYAAIAAEIEGHLQKDVIRAFFPRCVDRDNGGFHSAWGRDWTKQPSSGKFIVFQARMTWIASQIALRRPALREEFVGYARHGLRFLDQVMWDRDNGGFFWGVDDRGRIAADFGTDKHLYGEAFGLFAAAAAYEATGDQQALDLAVRAFQWLEAHAHDKTHGGYLEILTREGVPIEPKGPLTPASAGFQGRAFIYGTKSMNAHIHMLEALTQLHRVWKDAVCRARLEEVFTIVRDKIAVEPGCLNLWFTRDWRAVPDHDSFGHDIETAFLLIEAAEALGKADDAKTLRMARMLVDHALDWGWDEARGGFYDKGYAFATAFDTRKVWWSEVEGLNALLLMHDLFGKETDRYWRAFLKQWGFISRHMIDARHGGLFEEVTAEGKAERVNKSHNWKAAYHDGRSFLMVTERLGRMVK